MASTNFLTVKTHLSEFKSNSDKDTLSEVSKNFICKIILSINYVDKIRHFDNRDITKR